MLRLLVILLVCSPLVVLGQISQGGEPMDWATPEVHAATVPFTALSPLERSAEVTEEEAATMGAFQCGEQRFVEVDVLHQGAWTELADGGRVCRYEMQSPGAVMLSVLFDRFDLTEGAKVFLYNADRTFYIGAFTSANEQEDGQLATAVVPGDAVIIEFQEPAHAAPSELKVFSIMHGYRDIFHFGERGLLRDFDPGYQSSPCHNNVVCPVAANWQDQKRSVAIFVRPDGGGCSGVLLNNTAQNGTPYFLIANHCYLPNESGWVFYFNYESPACVGNVGPTTQSVSGSVRRSILYHGDYCLMQMNSTPPASYGVYYAGWDRSGTAPTSGAVIHHPLTDVKKITFYNTTATTANTEGEGTPCWRTFWNSGIVEAGSSGSPLFDQNKRVVGHMIDGPQTCATATTAASMSSKFSANWDGASAASRLRDWLDPANNTTALNGYDPNGSSTPAGVRVRLRAMLEGPYVSGSGQMNATLRDNGLISTSEPYAAMGYTHVGGGGGETTTSAVLGVTGSSAVVDWVVIELRNKNNSTQVVATRSALIRRDGTIVDTDGTSDVFFANRAADNYYIAIRHRNHLGIMISAQQSLSTSGTLLNLINGSVPLYGGSTATKNIGGILCMWAGDVVRDGHIRYTGGGNDRDPVLLRVGGAVPTAVASGYYREDVNMDGVVKYTGASNDRDPLLVNVGALPTSIRSAMLP